MPARRSPRPTPALDSLQRVRLELTALYREAKAGERDTSQATKLAYLLSLIARILETGELEKRLEAVERLAREARGQ